MELCRRGHYQPLLLVYTNPAAQSIDTSKAPRETHILSDGGSSRHTSSRTRTEPSVSLGAVPEEEEEEGEGGKGGGEGGVIGTLIPGVLIMCSCPS